MEAAPEVPLRRPRDLTLALCLFLLVFLTHAGSPSATSSDSYWTVPQILSILREGNVELSEFIGEFKGPHIRGLNCVEPGGRVIAGLGVRQDGVECASGSRFYGHYPVAVSFFGVIPMAVLDGALRLLALDPPESLPAVARSFFQRDYVTAHGPVEVVLASFLTGITAAFVFLLGREFLPRWTAAGLALLFAYATPAWSTGSRAMWQHTPEMMLVAICLYLLVAKGGRLAVWSAVPLAMAYFVRPTGALVAAGVTVYLYGQHRDKFWHWAALGLLTALPFVALNYTIYGSLLQPYFTEQRFLKVESSSVAPFLNALAGNLISPSRGLFVFSPIFLFAIAGALAGLRKRWKTQLICTILTILVLHWVAISAFADWTAGYCYGPRYFSDMTPLLMFLLIPLLADFPKSRPVQGLFVLALAFSFAVHFRGAVHWEVHQWNHPYVNPARAWDWTDPQFARGLLRK